MPKDFREYTDKEIRELIAKDCGAKAENVKMTYHKGWDDQREQTSTPSTVTARVLVKQ